MFKNLSLLFQSIKLLLSGNLDKKAQFSLLKSVVIFVIIMVILLIIFATRQKQGSEIVDNIDLSIG